MKIHYCIEKTVTLNDNLTDEEINEFLDTLTDGECSSWWKDTKNNYSEDTDIFDFLDDLNNGMK